MAHRSFRVKRILEQSTSPALPRAERVPCTQTAGLNTATDLRGSGPAGLVAVMRDERILEVSPEFFWRLSLVTRWD
jgi:hypothetical protein